MKLIKEYSAVSCFPLDISISCFFHIREEYCCLSSLDKKLYKNNDQELVCLDLAGEYRKIFYYGSSPEYFAYTWMKQKNEVVLHFLDQHMREFDALKLRTEGTGSVEDMWLDGEQGLLYLVFPLAIQVYNLNGDLLGPVMKAPMDTWYKAFCCDSDHMFVAYERLGCMYVAEYDCSGIFREKFGIGGGFSVGNMEIIHCDSGIHVNLYGKRQGRLAVCVELLAESALCHEIEIPETIPEPTNQSIGIPGEKKEIIVELSRGEGVGDTTCHISCPGD